MGGVRTSSGRDSGRHVCQGLRRAGSDPGPVTPITTPRCPAYCPRQHSALSAAAIYYSINAASPGNMLMYCSLIQPLVLLGWGAALKAQRGGGGGGIQGLHPRSSLSPGRHCPPSPARGLGRPLPSGPLPLPAFHRPACTRLQPLTSSYCHRPSYKYRRHPVIGYMVLSKMFDYNVIS